MFRRSSGGIREGVVRESARLWRRTGTSRLECLDGMRHSTPAMIVQKVERRVFALQFQSLTSTMLLVEATMRGCEAGNCKLDASIFGSFLGDSFSEPNETELGLQHEAYPIEVVKMSRKGYVQTMWMCM